MLGAFWESLLDSFPPEKRLQSGNSGEWKRTQSSPALLTPCLSNGLHLKSSISPHDSLAGCLLLMCFRYFSFKFSCLSEVALQNLSLGLPYYSFTINLPEHTITYVLVWAHFITLGQSENWDTTSPMHLLPLPSWGSFLSDITTSHL